MNDRPDRIRSFRRLADLTQAELARRVGVSKQTISDWERGACWPSIRAATALAQALGCSLDGLFVPAASWSAPDRSGAAVDPVAAPAAVVSAAARPAKARS